LAFRAPTADTGLAGIDVHIPEAEGAGVLLIRPAP
jgi:hypothetical protein